MKRRRLIVMALVLILTLAGMFLPRGVAYASPGWLSGWANRVKLTIDSGDIDAALSNFPILLYISASSGYNSDDISFVFDELTSDDNRKKIAVTQSDGETECYVEIEKWDDASEKAWLWVKAPSISSSADIDFYLYYDSSHADNDSYVGDTNDEVAENVWDSDFVFVCHMRDNPDNEHVRDSTGNDNDGAKTGAGAPAVTVDGKIDDAQVFDGQDDKIDVAEVANLDMSGDMTLEAWLNLTNYSDHHFLVCKQPSGTAGSNYPGNYEWKANTGTGKQNFMHQTSTGATCSSYASDSAIGTGAFHHIAVGLDVGSNVNFYLDGVPDGNPVQSTTVGILNDEPVRIGVRKDANSYLPGTMDEIRISKSLRSVSWIKASYESERDHLLDWESAPAAPIVTNSTGASDVTHNSARLNGELTQGSPDPTVHIYWGDEDGGTTPGSWDNDEDLGTKPFGVFYKDITGLTAEKTYYYRCYATNSEGNDWADSTAQFTTTGVPSYFQVGAASDDASESSSGSMKLDREAKVDSLGWAAFRWTGVNIPSGATITVAYVEVYLLKSGEDYFTDKTGYCENASNPGTFTTDAYDISNRTRTTNSAPLGTGQQGTGWKQLPSIVDLVQEVVDDQGGTGDALVYIIGNTGSTKLKMQSYDNDTALAAKLCIEYNIEDNAPPKVGTQIGGEYPITISPSAMTPQEEWTSITVPVQDADTLADVDEVQVKLFYDSAGSDPGEAGFSANVQTCAILTWTRGGAPWTIAPGSTTWAVNTGGCSKPSDSATQGNWVFSFKVGKVASHSPGSDDWDIYAKATDAASDTGEDYLRDKEMNWYGEITVNASGVDWGTVAMGSGFTDDTTNRVTASVTYICNGNFNKQIKASSPWGSSPTVDLVASETPGSGEFALKADDDLTLSGAVLVSTTYATFDTGTQTDESGTTEANNGIWLKAGSSGITGGVSYDGTIYYAITQS